MKYVRTTLVILFIGLAPWWGPGIRAAEKPEWDLWRPIEIHDQGGHYDFVPPSAEEGTYSMELFQAVYSGENTVPVLELAIREKGKEKSIAYTWADPSSERIGINLRTIQTGCKLAASRSPTSGGTD